MVKVELTYNPFRPRLGIIIDGREPDSYSRLIQYGDEPIWDWCDVIVEEIAAEIRRDFALEFVGLSTHAALVRRAASQCPSCTDFKAYRFEIDTPTNVRMGRLNQLIKQRRNLRCPQITVPVVFVVASSYARQSQGLASLAIANEYCRVIPQVVRLSEVRTMQLDRNAYLILLSDESGDVSKLPRTSRPTYQVRCAAKDSTESLGDGCLLVTTSDSDILDAVTTCLLDAPLTDAYVACLNYLGDSRIPHELRAIEPTVNVKVERRIELGRSNQIKLSVVPEGKQAPHVNFRVLDEKVATSDGLAVFGKGVGQTTLEAYYVGESTPFETIPIEVYKRNRITELLLSDSSVKVGIGASRRIKLEYVPEDADNVSAIRWASTNQEVATVSADGRITAKSKGACDIIVSAEGVTAKCRCVTLPYLKTLNVSMPLVMDTDGFYLMRPMQEAPFEIIRFPRDSIDGALEIKSSAYDVVNVVGTTAVAKHSGEAGIYISNSSKTWKVVIRIRVDKQRLQQREKEIAAEEERERLRLEREEKKRAKLEKKQQEQLEGKKRFFGLFG